jgi:hypothetical protein
MQTKNFIHSISLTHTRESLVGSALARYHDASIKFNEDPEKLKYWDYILYSIDDGWAAKCEQQEDYISQSLDDTLCLELYTHSHNDTTKQGKLLYSKAKKLIIILNKPKKVLIFDFKTIKNLIFRLEQSGDLKLHDGRQDPKWKEKHDTAPTICAIVPIQECLLHDASARVIDFKDLNLPEFYEEKLNPKNYN